MITGTFRSTAAKNSPNIRIRKGKVKILLVIPSLYGMGGTETVVRNLARLLGHLGHEVTTASFDESPAVEMELDLMNYEPMGSVKEFPGALRALSYLIGACKLARLKKRLRIELTISNLWRSDLLSVLSLGTDSKIALCHINVRDNPDNRSMMRYQAFVAWVYRRIDIVVAVNKSLARELSVLYQLPSEKVAAIPNFVERPDPDEVSKSVGKKIRFIWCGRFDSIKNLDGLLSAWTMFVNRNREAQLLLLGCGRLFNHTLSLARSLGLEVSQDANDPVAQVIFAGKVRTPVQHMREARSLLIASHAEGLPMVLLEALSVGTPVIAADCPAGGIYDVLSGQDYFQPGRSEAQIVSAGALMPIPIAGDMSSLSIWVNILERSLLDEQCFENWKQGARLLYQNYNPEAAACEWRKLIERVC